MPAPKSNEQPPEFADFAFIGGMLYPASIDSGTPLSLAIAAGQIVYVGPEEGLRPWLGPRTRRIELNGHTVVPGFVDAHMHPLLGGLGLLDCNLAGMASLPECQRTMRSYADAHPDLPFIRGGGWTLGIFPSEQPTKEFLDATIADRPVFLKAMDGHSMWANSLALHAAGIRAGTPQPPGGTIEFNAHTGEPTGWLKEWSAMALVESRFPAPTHEQRLRGARAFMEKAAREGLTSVSDAMLTDLEYRVYAELERRGELTVRVHGMALCRPEDGETERQNVLRLLRQPKTPFLRVGAVKMFLDGVLEAHTAWLKEPYADQPAHRGNLIWPENAFRREVARWDAQGFPVHVHAIGDGAVELAVDAIEQAGLANPRENAGHQIAHADMVRPAEVARMARLGIRAVVQPAWCYIDHAFFDTALPSLGRSRAFSLYPFRSMLRAGIPLSCGSDWPFGGDNAAFAPLEGIQVGATRLGIDRDYPTPYAPEEGVPLRAWLDAYTRNGAAAHFREREIGELREGMRADLVVLEGNLFERDLADIHSTRILLTLSDGRPTHHDSTWLGL